jgi:hypothetical protein
MFPLELLNKLFKEHSVFWQPCQLRKWSEANIKILLEHKKLTSFTNEGCATTINTLQN